jgi:hypothetical protein
MQKSHQYWETSNLRLERARIEVASGNAQNNFLEENTVMNARKPIRDAIIRKTFWRWKALALNQSAYGQSCPPSRARKNFWRLCARYPEIADKLGLNEGSVY